MLRSIPKVPLPAHIAPYLSVIYTKNKRKSNCLTDSDYTENTDILKPS